MKKYALFAVLLFGASLAFGQRDGMPSFTAADTFPNDAVNLVTLVPSLNLSMLPKSQGTLPGSIGIESPQSCQVVSVQKIVYCGSSGNSPLVQFFFIPNELLGLTTDAFSTTSQGCTTYTIHHLIGTDLLSSYSIPSTTLHWPSGCGSTSATVTTNDGTGITATLNAGTSTVSVSAAQNSSGWTSNNITSVSDSFSNSETIGSTSFTDTLGAVTNLNGANYVFQYTDTSGTSQNITTTNGTAATFVPLCGTNSTGSVTPISSINFPDSTAISLTWDTSGGGIDGLIKSFTLRTGGTITYTYGTLFQCVAGGVWAYNTLSRATPDGTTTYSMSFASGLTTTTVLDPGKNKVVYVFIGSPALPPNVLQSVTRYQNTGTVASPTYAEVSAESYCYNTVCGGTTVPTFPITTYEIKRYVGSGPTFMSDETQTFDSTYGNLLTDATTDEITSQTITKTIVYGTWNGSACVAITNTAVVDHPCTITTKNGATQLALETLTYNSNGAVTADANWISGTDTLTTNYTRNSTGTPATITLPNSQVITNTFGSCNSLLLTDSTTTVNSVAIDNKASWNCNAGVVTDTTDPNSNEDDYVYDSMNRLSSYTDRLENVTSYAYGTPTLDHVKITDPLSVVTYIYNDGLGRPTNTQVCQTTGCSNLDTSSTAYAWNGTNFETTTYVPCTKTTLNSACTTVALTADSNPVFGPVKTTDANSGTLTWARNSKDFSLTAGPAPSQENTKVIQTEVDGFGRTTSTCALEASGGTTCGQTMGNSGILTSNVYSFDSTTGAPKVVATRGSQTHTTIADAVGRVTSVATPEGGTVTWIYDKISTGNLCNSANTTSYGNLMQHNNADSTNVCFMHDGLYRLTDVGNSSSSSTNPCKRFRYDSTANKWTTAPTGYLASPYIEGRLFEAETDDCSGSIFTDEWFAYDKDGRMTDMWESTPHSSGYYHTTVTYDADGNVLTLSGIPSTSTLTFIMDGEGRPLNAELGTTWIVGSSSTTGVSYDAASRPLTIPIGSGGGSDTFTWDNVGNMLTYTFAGNSKSDSGTMTWNSIGSLGKLAIADTYNSSDAQTCAYAYDDVARIASVTSPTGSTCNATETYTYDQYDNLNQSGTFSWTATASSTNNQTTGSTYDSNGNVTYDGVNTYMWDIYGKMASARSSNSAAVCGTSGNCETYDAFGRIVEVNAAGTISPIMYGPIGYIGVAGYNVYIPMPGGGILDDIGGTLYYLHSDWLGTKRLATLISSGALYGDAAYAPYSQEYDLSGSLPGDFTGDIQIAFAGLWDTPNRELFSNSGRWLSPDPAHAGWNAYAYPTDPNTQTDRSGLQEGTSSPQTQGPCAAATQGGGGLAGDCIQGHLELAPRISGDTMTTANGTFSGAGSGSGPGSTVDPTMTRNTAAALTIGTSGFFKFSKNMTPNQVAFNKSQIPAAQEKLATLIEQRNSVGEYISNLARAGTSKRLNLTLTEKEYLMDVTIPAEVHQYEALSSEILDLSASIVKAGGIPGARGAMAYDLIPTLIVKGLGKIAGPATVVLSLEQSTADPGQGDADNYYHLSPNVVIPFWRDLQAWPGLEGPWPKLPRRCSTCD